MTTEESVDFKITNICIQSKNKNRVNVFVNGKYRFSVEISQVGELGLKIGKIFDLDQITAIEFEGQFSKLYSRALEYSLARPRSVKELRDYLWKKTLSKKHRTKSGEIINKPGVPESMASRVLDCLVEKGYVDDRAFAKWWVEYRNQTKGISQRKMRSELLAKGIKTGLIDEAINESSRNDNQELQKVINKKQRMYPDRQKFMAYLMRQGFLYEDIKATLDELER